MKGERRERDNCERVVQLLDAFVALRIDKSGNSVLSHILFASDEQRSLVVFLYSQFVK